MYNTRNKIIIIAVIYLEDNLIGLSFKTCMAYTQNANTPEAVE